ncbi:MAG: DNA polymerase III subunit delta [Psychroflexus sp.]|nr:DNA polymerase III subunit delta [Psychroflexus sp.]MDR9448009.1 DNA polymerase III subunit delta [Psychroflexus sp.]
MEFDQIIQNLRSKKFSPLYFLQGDSEPYFVDLIEHQIEKSVLAEHEKSFNQRIIYGKDIKADELIGLAKSFPMASEYKVIIIREAQDFARELPKMEGYFKSPQPTTVLVFCFKYKKVDKRKAYFKSLKKSGVIYESKPVYENQMPQWITKRLKSKGLSIEPKATQMLVDFLGNDLSKMDNELIKLEQIVDQSQTITPKIIEDNIGISKDFNNFELTNALGNRQEVKAQQIIQYFASNPKSNPILLTIGQLVSYFSKLIIYHSMENKSSQAVGRKLGIHPFFTKEISQACKNYSMRQCVNALHIIRQTDAQLKGIEARQISHSDLLKMLVVKIVRS